MAPLRMLRPNVSHNIRNPIYPFGRCINFGSGIRALNESVDHIKFEVVTSIDSIIQVLFLDSATDDALKPLPFTMEGDSIKIETKPTAHHKKYRTKISLLKHVQGDPKFECKDYSKENSYRKCMEYELTKKFHNLVGCHPPLISMKKDGLCNQTFNISKEDRIAKEISEILYDITNDYQSKLCKRPCSKYVFQTQELYENTRGPISSKLYHTPRIFDIKKSFIFLGKNAFKNSIGSQG